MAQEFHSGPGGDDRGSQGQCTTCIVGYVTQVTSGSDKTVTIKKSDKTVSHINHTLLPLSRKSQHSESKRGCSHSVTVAREVVHTVSHRVEWMLQAHCCSPGVRELKVMA